MLTCFLHLHERGSRDEDRQDPDEDGRSRMTRIQIQLVDELALFRVWVFDVCSEGSSA
jgi:hypothetical protein